MTLKRLFRATITKKIEFRATDEAEVKKLIQEYDPHVEIIEIVEENPDIYR